MGIKVTLREEVFHADYGMCVNCLAVQWSDGNAWQWQAHHVLKQQWLKRLGADAGDPSLAVLVCKRCHERHESRTAAIPLERLPMRVRKGVAELGDGAEDLLRRYHPPTELDAA